MNTFTGKKEGTSHDFYYRRYTQRLSQIFDIHFPGTAGDDTGRLRDHLRRFRWCLVSGKCKRNQFIQANSLEEVEKIRKGNQHRDGGCCCCRLCRFYIELCGETHWSCSFIAAYIGLILLFCIAHKIPPPRARKYPRKTPRTEYFLRAYLFRY